MTDGKNADVIDLFAVAADDGVPSGYSIAEPLQIDWMQCHTMSFLQNPDGTHGQLFFSALGVCSCPGVDPGPIDPNWPDSGLVVDLDTIYRLNVRAFVSLLDEEEHVALGVPTLYETMAGPEAALWHLPTPKGKAPPSIDLVDRVLDELEEYLARTMRCAIVFSAEGLGRAGTFAACWLARQTAGLALRVPAGDEMPFDVAALLMQTRQGRPGAVVTPDQEGFVGKYLNRERAQSALALRRLRMSTCARMMPGGQGGPG